MKMRIAVASEGLSGLRCCPRGVWALPSIHHRRHRRWRSEGNQSQEGSSADIPYGAGPLACTRLSKLGVNIVIAANFGPTVSAMLKAAEIKALTVKPGTKVKDAIQQYLVKR